MKTKPHPPSSKLERDMVALMQRQDLKSLTAQKAPSHQPPGAGKPHSNVPMHEVYPRERVRAGVFRGKPSSRGR